MIDTQSQPLFQRVAVFGVGLLGGSLGIACRRRGIADEVIGVGRNAERLEQALELGAIDRFTTDTRAGFAEADLIVMAAPVKTIIDFLPVVRDAAPDGAIVTDVGSAKSAIARVADKVFADSEMAFIGSHPMAGGEQMGVANARGDLYEGAACVLTPTEQSNATAFARLEAFWQALGARVLTYSPEEHDNIVATVSHLPHAVAVALANALAIGSVGPEDMREVAGPGLLDTTRIAAGSVDMWRDIFQENRAATLSAIDAFTRALGEVRGAIESGDPQALEDILRRARDTRLFFGNRTASNETEQPS